MRIYLAGPLFTAAEWHWNSQLADVLRAAGHEVFLPQEHAEKYLDETGQITDPSSLFGDNVSEIDDAQAVLAILDGADVDSGTAWEVGYAVAKNKLIVGLRTDLRRSGDTEDDLNLMLAQSLNKRLLLRNPGLSIQSLGEQLAEVLKNSG